MPPRLRLSHLPRPLLHLRSRTIQTQHPTITKPNVPSPNSSATNVTPAGAADPSTLQESVEAGEVKRHMQAPNRATTWSKSQQPRELGMVGPRFENTIMELQPAPYAAIELIHRQPVRFSEKRVVACDGGGGPMGHPRIFINVDKPEIVPCGYCGLPFAHVHHRKVLEAQETTDYPLS
ncbi:zinc-finger domain-domain-containing protein [Tuber borchii]|uniref:Zinc-finger domain-domain-containing protein n=1 Tax=Tuber borchii TaxID=42251 RepID=A0A2T6ZVH9_TUBBO|nr:zinc-finger domain-domain-containing protein [Tuber borchii]